MPTSPSYWEVEDELDVDELEALHEAHPDIYPPFDDELTEDDTWDN
jgi:hypothetical protein